MVEGYGTNVSERMNKLKRIYVDLKNEKLRAEERINNTWSTKFEFHCITGDDDVPQNATHIGDFSIGRKEKDYVSQKYNVPMPYSLFFDKGRAFHQTDHAEFRSFLQSIGINYFSTHGCVGLSGEAAKQLFEWAEIYTSVFVRESI